MAAPRQNYFDKPGTTFRQKPTATEMPLAKLYEADKKQGTTAARQAQKLEVQVSRRAKERLDIAEARHRNVLAGIEAQRDADAARLYAKTSAYEMEAQRVETAALSSVEQIEAATRATEAQIATHTAAQQMAVEQVAAARADGAENTRVVEAQVREAQEQAEQAKSSTRENVQNRLGELRQMREDIQEKRANYVNEREKAKESVLQTMDAQSHIETVRSEVTREHAALAMDLASARSRQMSTDAQVRISRNEALAADHAFQLSKAKHLMEGQVDCVLGEKLQESALNLEEAHEYCHQVRRLLANENAQFKRRMRQIELEAAASARAEERKVLDLEKDRLSKFMEGQQVVNQTESQLRTKRTECETEIDEVHRRLRQAEEDSRKRADQILAQWTAGSDAAEQAVRQLELQGRQIMEMMQNKVNNKLKACSKQNKTVQEQGTASVVELEKKGNMVVDNTQPALEVARRDDEREAVVATQKGREARHIPEQISKEADVEIEVKNALAREAELELSREADVRIAAARAATKAAHEEEKWLQAESSEAWSRIRKACFELRQSNLHDFAHGIVAGNYDAQVCEKTGDVVNH